MKMKLSGFYKNIDNRLNISNNLYLKISTNDRLPKILCQETAYYSLDNDIFPSQFYCIISRSSEFGLNVFNDNVSNIIVDKDVCTLEDGDIIRLSPNGRLKVMYRANANVNYLFVTEQCDNYCIMCSQPPRVIDDSYIFDDLKKTLNLMPVATREIGITGGEPTLNFDKFIDFVSSLKSQLPYSSIHILSNGKKFSDIDRAQELSQIKARDLMVGIPLYSSVSHTHDYIVQDEGAFDKTIAGILNLKQCGVKVELRCVIQKSNFLKLDLLADYIIRNLQFVDQVAFMALEDTGFAKLNASHVWVEPIVYKSELSAVVRKLDRAKIKVKIFNHQLCLLEKDVWQYSVQSISDWKNTYIDECIQCQYKNKCGGFFSTSKKVPSGIKRL